MPLIVQIFSELIHESFIINHHLFKLTSEPKSGLSRLNDFSYEYFNIFVKTNCVGLTSISKTRILMDLVVKTKFTQNIIDLMKT